MSTVPKLGSFSVALVMISGSLVRIGIVGQHVKRDRLPGLRDIARIVLRVWRTVGIAYRDRDVFDICQPARIGGHDLNVIGVVTIRVGRVLEIGGCDKAQFARCSDRW